MVNKVWLHSRCYTTKIINFWNRMPVDSIAILPMNTLQLLYGNRPCFPWPDIDKRFVNYYFENWDFIGFTIHLLTFQSFFTVLAWHLIIDSLWRCHMLTMDFLLQTSGSSLTGNIFSIEERLTFDTLSVYPIIVWICRRVPFQDS